MGMGLRAKTARVSASARFVSVASRRRVSPVAWLLAGIGACLAVVATFILFADPVDAGAAFDARIGIAEREIAVLESQGRFLDAAAGLDGLVRQVAGREEYVGRAAEWRARARSDRDLAAELRKAYEEFLSLKARAEKASKDELRPLWEEGQRLKSRIAGAPVSWKKEVDDLLAAIERRMVPPSEPWQKARDRISAECRLDRRGEADWSRALRLWKEFLAGSAGAADRSGAESELRSIQARVREDFALVRGKVQRLREAGRPDEARAEAAKHRPRFAGTSAEAEIEVLARSP
jgi:hypothetical protein